MTEEQLSGEFGLTKAAVGYHLHLLLKAGLIGITKLEAEKHGILQKYYAPMAALFIIDTDNLPKDVKRFFIQTQIEHSRVCSSSADSTSAYLRFLQKKSKNWQRHC